MKSNKIINIILSVIFIIFLILVVNKKFGGGNVRYNNSSNLINVEDIKDLYVVNFTWNGIAEKYNEKNDKKVENYIKYESVIEAKINAEDINNNIKIENKKYIITLPKIELVPKIIIKNDSFSFIPENSSLDLKELLNICEEDAIKEAQKNKELIKIAKENAKNTIEGLLLPITEQNNYKIVWKED